MASPSTESLLNAKTPKTPPRPAEPLIPDVVKTFLILVLFVAVGYLLYDSYQFREKNRVEMAKISEQLKALERQAETKISGLRGELSQTQAAVGSTKAELNKRAQEIASEGQRTRSELTHALAGKADSAQLTALRNEADTKIGQVTSEVGGVKTEVGTVKTEVGTVKTDLASTKRDLEGTQRQLVDVRESLSAAVAKNSTELAELRRKGERDYFEFELPKKNLLTKVEDIRLILKKTDAKKGKYTVQIIVDDNRLEKKDRTINEPIQFLVGRNRIRYELVVNWVQKDKAGGYLSIPKDRNLSAEHAAK